MLCYFYKYNDFDIESDVQPYVFKSKYLRKQRNFLDKDKWGAISVSIPPSYRNRENLLKELSNYFNWTWLADIISDDLLKEFHHKVNWGELFVLMNDTNDIERFKEYLDWEPVSSKCCYTYYEISPAEFARLFQDKIDWTIFCSDQRIDRKFIKEFHHKIDWQEILIFKPYLITKNLIEEMVNENIDLPWDIICNYYSHINYSFVKRFMGFIKWDFLCSNSFFHLGFLQKFYNKIDWSFVLVWAQVDYNELIEVIRKLVKGGKKLPWHQISEFYRINSDFVKEFKDYINWKTICKNTKVDENFIREFYKEIDWKCLFLFKPNIMTDNFIKEMLELDLSWSVKRDLKILLSMLNEIEGE